MGKATYKFECKNNQCRYESGKVSEVVLMKLGKVSSIVIDLEKKAIVTIGKDTRDSFFPVRKGQTSKILEAMKSGKRKFLSHKELEEKRKGKEAFSKKYMELNSDALVNSRMSLRDKIMIYFLHHGIKLFVKKPDIEMTAIRRTKENGNKEITEEDNEFENEDIEYEIRSKYYWTKMDFINCPKCGKLTLEWKEVSYLFID